MIPRLLIPLLTATTTLAFVCGVAAQEGTTEDAVEELPSCEIAKNAKQCKAICTEKFRKEKDRKRQEKKEREALEASEQLPTHGWITVGVGLGLIVGGAVTGGVALKLNGNLEGNCPGGVCDPKYYDDLDRRDRLSVWSTALLSAGVTGTLVGILILTVFSRGPVKVEDGTGEVALLPMLGPGGSTGAVLEWRF